MLVAHMRHGGHNTARSYVRSHHVGGRAGHEVRRLSQIIDAATAAGFSLDHEFMEIAVRALCGIVLAEQHGNQALLDQMEWNPPAAAVPAELTHLVIKRANRAKHASSKTSGAAPPDKKQSKSPGADKKRPGKE